LFINYYYNWNKYDGQKFRWLGKRTDIHLWECG
jgi:hypothetical protein